VNASCVLHLGPALQLALAMTSFVAPAATGAALSPAGSEIILSSSMENGEVAACLNFYDQSFTPVLGQVVVSVPNVPKPAKWQELEDPSFHTCIARSTDHAVEPPVDFARNDYSRRQAFNADDSFFVAYSNNGAWHLYDANSLLYVRELNGPAGDAEVHWHPTNPSLLRYLPTAGGTEIHQLNVVTNVNTRIANFPAGRLPWTGIAHIWTKAEGSPSADGNIWCFMAETSSFQTRGIFSYNLATDTVLATFTTNQRPDHLSTSPSGRWCVVSYDDEVYATDIATLTQHRFIQSRSEHSDIAIGANGNDIYVAVDYEVTGDMFMVDIDANQKTTLFPTYLQGTATAYHVSGKAFARPGWVLVSTYNAELFGNPMQWLHERIFAVELSANPTIVNLAHHHARVIDYFAEPHASVNRDFTRILFNSTWENNNLNVDAYQLRLPANAIP
jgi:hypothetical protein